MTENIDGLDNLTNEDSVVEETPKVKPKRSSKAKKNDSDATALAEECLVGKWGTGRDRDLRLKAAGHDPDAVRKEVYRIRGERIKAPKGS